MPGKPLYFKIIKSLTGELATALFRLLVTFVLVFFHLTWEKVKVINDLPNQVDGLTKKVSALSKNIDDRLDAMHQAEVKERQTLITRAQLEVAFSEFQKDKNVVNASLQQQDKRISVLEGQFTTVQTSLQKILNALVK